MRFECLKNTKIAPSSFTPKRQHSTSVGGSTVGRLLECDFISFSYEKIGIGTKYVKRWCLDNNIDLCQGLAS
jgi:hypothetical protein